MLNPAMLVGDYKRCPNCRTIIHDPELELGNLSQPTPCCGSSGEARILWPSAESLQYLGMVSNQDLSTPEGRRIAIVFLSSILELLLEESLREVLQTHVKTDKLMEYILENVKGRESRMRLYASLLGRKFQTIMAGIGHSSFHQDWEKLAKARNSIAHGKYHYDRTVSPAFITRLHGDCLGVFALLQNYARNGTVQVPRPL